MAIPNADGHQDKGTKGANWAHWNSDLMAGKRGENAWAMHMTTRGYKVCESTLEQNKMGIDMFAINPDGGITSFDTKNDRVAHRTGNLGFEDRMDYHDGRTREGWAHKANCDFFVILEKVGYNQFVYHLFKAEELVRKMDGLREAYRSLSTKRDPNKLTWNIIVPKADLALLFDSYSTGEVDQ